jgi:CheY-like chemotaxis protein
MNSKKVLAIDDEQIVLDSVRKILSQEGFEVTTVLSGQEGIRRATADRFDIVLTDIRMPDISGKIVLREVKRVRPALPVVIVTGYTSVQSALQSLKLGASDVLEKPFTPEELVQVVNDAIEKATRFGMHEQGLIHENQIRSIINHAVDDPKFAKQLAENGADLLDQYDLTAAEKLALITGDIEWFEGYMGILPTKLRKFFAMNAKPISA